MGRAFGFGVTWSPFVYVCVHLCRHLQCVCAGKKRSKFQEQVFKKKVMGGLGISIHLKSIHLCVCSQEKKQPRHLYPPVTTTTTPFWGTCVCLSTKLQSTGVQCCFQTFIFGIQEHCTMYYNVQCTLCSIHPISFSSTPSLTLSKQTSK